MPDGEDTSWLCPVTEGRVAKMPGGEAVGKCRLMRGLEVGVPGREAMGEHWELIFFLQCHLISVALKAIF